MLLLLIFTTYIDILFHYFNTSNAWYIFSVLHKLRSDPKLFFFRRRHTVKKPFQTRYTYPLNTRKQKIKKCPSNYDDDDSEVKELMERRLTFKNISPKTRYSTLGERENTAQYLKTFYARKHFRQMCEQSRHQQ